MEVRELIKILLDECDGITTKEVKFDGSIPVPLEEIFEIKAGKSWVLFKQRKIEHTQETAK